MSSVNAFSSDRPKILSRGKGLNLQMRTLRSNDLKKQAITFLSYIKKVLTTTTYLLISQRHEFIKITSGTGSLEMSDRMDST